MQPSKVLETWLQNNANDEHYLFSLKDLKTLCPGLTHTAFKTLLSRLVKSGFLERVCRGLYAYK